MTTLMMMMMMMMMMKLFKTIITMMMMAFMNCEKVKMHLAVLPSDQKKGNGVRDKREKESVKMRLEKNDGCYQIA